MNYRIVEREAFSIIGKGVRVSTENGENSKKIPEFWQESNQDGTTEQLLPFAKNMGFLGLCLDFDKVQHDFIYMIAVVKPNGANVPASFEERKIPKATWAVFDAIGPLPHSVQELWQRIFSEWFPATGYEHSGAPEMEVYPVGEDVTSDLNRTEIWVPIRK
ncbi:GyrI-like domain-containing protein [Halalkalibacter kiskunsagensis]|uniref:GyrI-like domain-containing protein n=1 Tax=Halalkalibacter kiskunsagensis TaxID=1548599 RepID=A0ABV6K9P0_9BACI